MIFKSVPITLLIFTISSCENKVEKKSQMNEVVYDFLKSISMKDKTAFSYHFDFETMGELTTSQFDYTYNNTIFITKDYSLPDYKTWIKYRPIYSDDTVQKVIRVGLPFISNRTGTFPEYTFFISYKEDGLFNGFRIKKTPLAEELSDRSFPNKMEQFYFPLDNLISIQIYYLHGTNGYSDSIKQIEFRDKKLTEDIIKSIEPIFNTLDKSTILLAKKHSIKEIKNLNNLISINFTFKDKYDAYVLQIVSPAINSEYIEVYHFYTMNAAYKYELSIEDKDKLNSILNTLKKTYLN